MTKFVNNEAQEDDILFVTFGALKANQDKAKAYLVKAGESIEGIVTSIKDSPKKYKKIYTLKVKGEEKPLIITGKTDLVKKMGHDPTVKVPKVVAVNDLVQITFVGVTKTSNNNNYFNFEVGVAQ